jgi:hypothetical protein
MCSLSPVSATGRCRLPINEALVRDLATGAFLSSQRNACLSAARAREDHLSIAIARSCIREVARHPVGPAIAVRQIRTMNLALDLQRTEQRPADVHRRVVVGHKPKIGDRCAV